MAKEKIKKTIIHKAQKTSISVLQISFLIFLIRRLLLSLISVTHKKQQVVFVIIVSLLALLYLSRSLFVAVIVNGEPITRLTLIKQLENQYGKEALNSLVTKQLILQEAKKQKVVVTDADADVEIAKIEASLTKSGQNFNELLKAQNMTRDSLAQQIKIEKIIQKMIGKDVTITDKEVSDYFEKNSGFYPEGATLDQMKESIKQQIQQQKTSEKFQSWLDEVQKKAKINYFVSF